MKKRILFVIFSVISFAGIVYLLNREGVSSRVYAITYAINDKEAPVYILDKTTDVYSLWERSGVKGRIVVNVSRYLHFIALDSKINDLVLKAAKGKIDIINEYEKDLSYKNFLLTAMEKNMARQTYHVLPLGAFREKLDLFQGGEDIFMNNKEIVTHYKGSKRIMRSGIPRIEEPIILNIDASYFYSSDPEEFIKELKSSGLKIDMITFCLAKDNPEVADAERERLMESVKFYQRQG